MKIGNNCSFGPGCNIWIDNDDVQVIIGDNCTFSRDCQLCAQENMSSIVLGDDCQFASNIIVRTSDSHPIFDCITNKRINKPKKVVLGNHVWVAQNTSIMKGCHIGNGAVIGSHSIVTKDVPDNVIVVGNPAKVIKERIYWKRY